MTDVAGFAEASAPKTDAKPDPREAANGALEAVASWADRLHAMTFQAYAEARNSYGWSSLHAAIEIRVTAAKAMRALNGGAPQPIVAARIVQTVNAIKAAGRRIKADIEFYNVRAMDDWPAVFERLDWQSLVLTRLADGPLSAAVPHAPSPPPPAPPPQPTVDKHGQGSMF